MRRSSIIALIAAMGISGISALPVQAASQGNIAEQLKTKGYSVTVKKANSFDEVKDIMKELCVDFNKTDWKDCPIITLPGGNQPDTDQPEDNQPETDTEKPDTDQPENNRPGNDTNKPDTDRPGTGTEELSFAEQVVKLVNEERAKAGLSALTLDKDIEAASLIRSKEIEVSFSHTRPDGRKFSTVLQDNGITFRGAGENIAWGQKSPQDVMNAWMNSDGHRANILNAKYTRIGVGYYQNASGRNYWTQIFTY